VAAPAAAPRPLTVPPQARAALSAAAGALSPAKAAGPVGDPAGAVPASPLSLLAAVRRWDGAGRAAMSYLAAILVAMGALLPVARRIRPVSVEEVAVVRAEN
jgi:hypothetical protein